MWLALQAFIELVRYKILLRSGGFRKVHEDVRALPVTACIDRKESQSVCVAEVVQAVTLASCFFWKPVLCLPRAVAATRLLRQRGVAAQLVIGYRPSPFMSHAWVEVDGRIVNDSAEFQKRLLVLDRL